MRLLTLLLPLTLLGAACGSPPVDQTSACAEWVECVAARDAALGTTTDYQRFDVGGACWGSQEGADLCTTSCEQGLTFLRDNYDDVPEGCLP